MFVRGLFNPFPHTTNLQQTTLKVQLLLNRLENMVTKGEIARLSNFFFCRHVFKKPSAAEASESVYVWERVKFEALFLKHPYFNQNGLIFVNDGKNIF